MTKQKNDEIFIGGEKLEWRWRNKKALQYLK
jgi:hypothetical protein